MHLDEALHFNILEKTGIFSNRLSIQEPRVLMTSKEVLEMPKEITIGRRTTAYKYYGVSYMKHNLIFINVKKIPDEKALEDTIAHELVHHMQFETGETLDGDTGSPCENQANSLAGQIIRLYGKKCPSFYDN